MLFELLSQTFLRNKLVQGHGIHSTSKAVLIGILRSSPWLERVSQPAGTLAVFKEYSAALLWVDAPVFSALKNLSADARATLCTLFCLLRTPLNPDARAHRIMNFVQAKRAQNASRTSMQVGSGVAPATQAAQAAT